MSDKVILEENVKLQETATDWKDAVRKSGQLLIDSGFIKEGYVTKTIDVVEELGPYIVLAPGLALAHARPDENVLKTGVSLLTITTPVEFNCDNDPVDIILTLAAINDTDHMGMLGKLSMYLSEEGQLEKIKNCTDEIALAKEINEYEA